MGCCSSRAGPHNVQDYITSSPGPQSASLDWELLGQLDLQRYSQLQNDYMRQWRLAECAFDLPRHEGGNMDYPLLKRLKPFLLCGVPDSVLSRVMVRLFRLNSNVNAEHFNAQRKYFLGREPCLFGRKNQSNLLLSAAGQQVRPR
jgi:hypothetical protein